MYKTCILALLVASTLSIHLSQGPYAAPCRRRPSRRSSDNSWDNISVSSSGATELKNATGGASLTSNKKVENLLMNDKARGKSVNHYRKSEKSRMIGETVSSLETNGNAEIDIGSPSLLKRSRRRRSRRRCGCWGRPWGYKRDNWGQGHWGHSHSHSHSHKHHERPRVAVRVKGHLKGKGRASLWVGEQNDEE